MKKASLLLSIFFVFSLLMSTSCNKDSKEEPQPTAYFNAPSSVDVGQTVYFQNESQNAYKYYWSFGDGSESNETNPTHTYYSSGYKTVSMTAYSVSGNKQLFKIHLCRTQHWRLYVLDRLFNRICDNCYIEWQ